MQSTTELSFASQLSTTQQAVELRMICSFSAVYYSFYFKGRHSAIQQGLISSLIL